MKFEMIYGMSIRAASAVCLTPLTSLSLMQGGRYAA